MKFTLKYFMCIHSYNPAYCNKPDGRKIKKLFRDIEKSIAKKLFFHCRDTTKITLVPFYGGGKGQSLQITATAEGAVISAIIVKTPDQPIVEMEQTEIEKEIDPTELENPPLPTKFETELYEGYEGYIRTIQSRANDIVKLQEIAKKNGQLTPEEEKAYAEHMKSINESAKKLAEIQESPNLLTESREGLSQWFERKKDNTKDKNKKREEEKKRKKENEEKEQKRKNEEKKKQQGAQKEQEEEEDEQGDDSVAINLPPDDASVAEAKPVGLAVAGVGGVAASKPIATAVVGPGGLAIARPVATAIAGVSPDQALIPIYGGELLSGAHKKSSNKQDQMSEYLNKIISKYHQT
ncbi:hypothetical protein HUJ04_002778 [Dendroctonus ponderosae]|nr:hypothetical protein HUJ04_002778 [Dendroctonus ponderosae]